MLIVGLYQLVLVMTLLLSVPFRLQQQFGFTPGEVGAVIAPWPAA